MEYVLHILILISIYLALSVSLNLIAGYTGMLSIAHAAFYGVGAYVAAMMALGWGSPFLVSLLCAGGFAGVVGAVVGLSALRTKGDQFVIATFAFQVVLFSVLNNFAFTGGPSGLPGIPRPVLFGWQVSSHIEFLILAMGLCGVVVLVSRQIVMSPIGRVLKAIREDETLAVATGKNVAAYKVLIFAAGACMAGLAGAFYAYYISFIDPTSFTVMESIFIISIVIIGGSGSLWGSVVGAIILVILPEALRHIGLPSSIAANLRQITYGVLLVAMMMWRPQGLLGEYSFERNASES